MSVFPSPQISGTRLMLGFLKEILLVEVVPEFTQVEFTISKPFRDVRGISQGSGDH